MIDKTVSHYRILEKIGGGGMGVVYKAEDTKLRRTVALKFLAPELTRDEDAKRRFVHEAQAASALDHPNICSIYDIDETPEGQLYIAMACYDGESVKERIARRRIEVREAFEIAYSVAQGLARAHASGIIHRDIKPGNIMITQDGFVKIVDFGLAKLIGRSRITGSGATLGTIAYMSPEQARSEDSDARADIWALGVVLYEMLTGKLPFRGEIDQAVVFSILNQEPQPVQELRSDVPDECAAVVAKCLQKNPEARYQSALEFCAALVEMSTVLEWTSFSSGAVRAVSIVSNGRRRRGRSTMLVGIAAAALAIGTAAWYHWRPSSTYTTDTRLAVMPFERVGDSPSKAFVDGLARCTASLAESNKPNDAIWVVPYERMSNERLPPMDQISAALGVNQLLKGQVGTYRDGHRLTLTLIDAKTQRPIRSATVGFHLSTIHSLPDSIAGAMHSMIGATFDPQESLMAGLSDTATALTFVESLGLLQNWRVGSYASDASARVASADASTSPSLLAVEGFAHYARYRRSLETEQPDTTELQAAEKSLRAAVTASHSPPEARVWLGYVYRWMKRSTDRIAVLEEGAKERPDNIMIRESLGSAYIEEQRFDEAIAAFKDLNHRKQDYAHGYWCVGWVYWRTGQRDLELAANEQAFKFAPGSYRVLNSLGLYYDADGDLPKAREYFQRAYLAEPNCASCSNVGRVLYFEQRYKESARYYEYALEYCDTTKYDKWANLAGSLFYVEGQRDRAKSIYRRAIKLARERLESVPDDTETAAMLADFYSMIDNRDDAFAMVERATGSSDARAVFRIAQVYEHFGQRKEALDYMDRALQLKMPMHEIVNEPLMSDLVKDPRFEKMSTAAMAQAAKPGS